IVRCKDANVSEPAKCVIKCVDFDAHSDLMLAGGLDKVLRLYKVDGEENPRAVSVLFKDTPIFCAQFVEKGTVVVSGRRPWYHKYDVDTGATQKVPRQLGARDKSLEKFAASPDGQWLAFTCDGGSVALADARRSQWVQDDLKMSGSARAVAFSSDSRRLYTAGGDAEVYVWDLRSRRCLEKFQDAGASKSSSLACVAAPAHHRLDDSMHRDFLAVGTEAGVVNVYDRGCNDVAPPSLRPAPAMPLRGVMSLTTTVDSVAFSPDGQIAAIASKWSKDALRLVHLPSCRVVANWPTHSTPLHYVTSVAFSKRAGYLAIGNDRGRVLLYKLQQKAGF
ncbi:WD40-repeat-containing domain protein, partial [Pelagophyceae sp. CCMP2097]